MNDTPKKKEPFFKRRIVKRLDFPSMHGVGWYAKVLQLLTKPTADKSSDHKEDEEV